jgi:5-methylcytosine-specific restriction endonuclease McrA
MDRALEELVWRRAHGCCEYCQLPQQGHELHFEIDHVIALKHRGPTRADNLSLACFACNNHKGTNTLA